MICDPAVIRLLLAGTVLLVAVAVVVSVAFERQNRALREEIRLLRRWRPR